MKVLHINVNYTTNVLHSNMVKYLEKYGMENSVFVPVAFSSSYKTDDNGVNVIKCFNKLDKINYYSKQKKILATAEKNFKVDEFDVLHSYTVFTDGNIAYQLHKKYGVPYVVAVRNTDVNTFFKYMPHLRNRGVEILKNARAVFFLSQKYKERTFSKYIPKELHKEIENKTYIQPNGIDPYWLDNIYNKAETTENTVKVVSAGGIDKNKNMAVIAEALSLLEKEGKRVSLDIAGGIKDNNEAEKLKKYSFVKLHGKLNKTELSELYRKCDVFALASFTETFGMVYIEAMSQHLPVIYTKNEGFDGQFPEGEVGFHVNPSDPNEIAVKISEAYEKRIEIGERCVSAVRKFNWDAITQKYSEIYSEIIR